MEFEIIFLRKELEKSISYLNRILKFGKHTRILDDIISFRIPPLIKISTSYDMNKKNLIDDPYSQATKKQKKENEGKSRSYADVLKSFIKKEGNMKKENEVL